MRNATFLVLLFSFLLIFGPYIRSAQQPDYTVAEAYGRNGKAKEMERAYAAILERAPNDVQALVGRGTARSWLGNYSEARADFLRALDLDPHNLGAEVGMGYALAWDGQHADALDSFDRALEVAPDNLGALKGRAFTQLWSESFDAAARSFEKLQVRFPADAEVAEGLAQAQLAIGETDQARRQLRRAIHLDPNRESARSTLDATGPRPPRLEFSLYGGSSASGSDTSVRLAELGTWLTPSTRLGVRYDNSLSLDNSALARSGEEAESYFLAAQHNFGDRFIGLAEVGTRELPGNEDQQIYKLEGVRLGTGKFLKLGVQLSPHSSGFDDKLIYGGGGLLLRPSLRIEGTLFLAQQGFVEDEEGRLAGYLEYNRKRWTIGFGAGAGTIESDVPAADGSITTAVSSTSYRFASNHQLHAQVRWEDAPLDSFTVWVVGVTLRIPRR